MSRRTGERHEHLARPRTPQPDIVFYDRIAAGKAVFDPQPSKNPLRRVPLLRWRRLICLEDRIDDWNERAKLRPLSFLPAQVAGRRRTATHLGDRLPAQSENPCRLPPALPFNKNKPSNRRVSLHCTHPRPPFPIKLRKRVSPESGRVLLPQPTAICRRSVAY